MHLVTKNDLEAFATKADLRGVELRLELRIEQTAHRTTINVVRMLAGLMALAVLIAVPLFHH